jgi:hypothetical protein
MEATLTFVVYHKLGSAWPPSHHDVYIRWRRSYSAPCRPELSRTVLGTTLGQDTWPRLTGVMYAVQPWSAGDAATYKATGHVMQTRKPAEQACTLCYINIPSRTLQHANCCYTQPPQKTGYLIC